MNTNTQATISIESEAQAIAALVTKGIEAWHEAGKRLCSIIDASPDGFDRICKAIPSLSPNIIYQLERIGRKQLVPELLLKDGPAVGRLMKLPFSAQQRALSAPIDLLVVNNGEVETLKVDIDDMTPAQARQVFSKEGIRDLGAQRAYLANSQRENLPEVKESAKPYSISGRTLTIIKPCALTLTDLGIILAEMKS